MNNQERYEYFNSGILQRATAIELLDWANYWTTTGIDGITDPLLRLQTKTAIRMILTDLGRINKFVAHMAISYPDIKDAVEPTELNIHNVVTNIMSFKLAWITGITEVPATEGE